jgi:electron transport complex protein RnfG
MIKMIVVLTVLSSLSGGLLAALRDSTADKIENQQLQFVKGPAIKDILKGISNNPIKDRFKIDGTSFFTGKIGDKPKLVAFEEYGKGFGGDIGVMVAVDIDSDKIVGIGVTTHSETPGVGSRAKTESTLSDQFRGLDLAETFKVKQDGGQIAAISGASVSSRGVCAAVTRAGEIYKQLKPQITEQIKKQF